MFHMQTQFIAKNFGLITKKMVDLVCLDTNVRGNGKYKLSREFIREHFERLLKVGRKYVPI